MPTNKADLGQNIFQLFSTGQFKSLKATKKTKKIPATTEKSLQDLGVAKDKVNDLINSHYYLAARNLKQAQLLLAMLTITLAVAISAVRQGNDLTVLLLALGIGLGLSLPYWLIYFAMIRTQLLSNFRLLSYSSLGYTVFLALIFLIASPAIQLVGVILVPVIIIVLYIIEVRKLELLINSLNTQLDKIKLN